MKKLGLLFGAVFAMLASSCEGPTGPPGPPGVPGVDGVNILGQVYDIVGDFTPGNEYTIFTDFALDGGVEVFETDVVLVYILWEQLDDSTGPIDVWRLLPQTRLLDRGILQYNYDFTFFDATIFLETDFDPVFLGPGDTLDQVFRIAILPADGAGMDGLDVSNMQEVMDYLNRDESSVKRFELD